jgi:hypothetical protein
METSNEELETSIVSVETVEAMPKKVNPIGRGVYGENFQGFQSVKALVDDIPAFKEFFYEEKIKDFKKSVYDIVREFNKLLMVPEGKTFYPYTAQLKSWEKKWNYDIIEQKKVDHMPVAEQKAIAQIMNTRKPRSEGGTVELGRVGYNDLEQGVQTLGGELLNDALQMLQDDQALEELYDDEVLIKRRKYITDVFGQVTKMVHGKANLLLKTSAEKRENANFMMTLLAKAASGKMTDAELEALELTHKPTTTNV